MQQFLILDAIRRRFVSIFGCYAYRSYWHYFMHRTNVNSDFSSFYMSAVPNQQAGIGHQIANWIAGLWFSMQFKVNFAHYPFSSVEWDDFLGFKDGFKSVNTLKEEGYSVIRIPKFDENNQMELERINKIMSSYSGKKIVFLCEQDQFYMDQFGVMDIIQEKFYNADTRKTQKIEYSSKNFNIAIHVRRGDIMRDLSNINLTMRYLSNDYFYKVLSQSISHFSRTQEKPIHVWIFSQGKIEDYPEFSRFSNIHWCLNMDAKFSFLHMVYADLLITSKSSFSYKPALLNKGIKIVPENFWHGYPSSKDWIIANSNGIINF